MVMNDTVPAPTLEKKLGKHKAAKACLYIKRLADVDVGVLEKLVQQSVAEMRKSWKVVVPVDKAFRIQSDTRNGEVVYALDGLECGTIGAGEAITVRRSALSFQMVRLEVGGVRA